MSANERRPDPRGEEEEPLRLRVVRAVEEGQTQSEASRVFGVTRASVNRWMGLYRERGAEGLQPRPRGRPRQRQLTLAGSAGALRLILERLPDEVGLPQPLWTREAVQLLLEQRFGVTASRWTVARYMDDWGLEIPGPAAAGPRAPGQANGAGRPEDERFAAARRRARKEQASLQVLRHIDAPGRQPGRSVLAAVSGRGEFAFLAYFGRLTGRVAWTFLDRLSAHVKGRKVILVTGADTGFWAEHASGWRRARAPAHDVVVQGAE